MNRSSKKGEKVSKQGPKQSRALPKVLLAERKSPFAQKRSLNRPNNNYTDEQLETIISYLSNQIHYYIDIQQERKIKQRISNNKKLHPELQLL